MQTWRGIDWDSRVPIHQRHLELWQRWREPPYCFANLLNPVGEHFLEACRMLFTEKQLKIHPWFEAMTHAYAEHDGVILLGAASSGKSHWAGYTLLLDYITDPQNLYACMVSTSKDMLLMRSMASAIEALHNLKASGKLSVPFKYVAQKCAIVPDDIDDANFPNVKAMVKGVAIREGSVQDAKAAIMGVHLPRVRTCADEFENMESRAQAFLDAQDNLAASGQHKMILLFNPQSRFAPGCLLATPKAGWSSVEVERDDSWMTRENYRVLRLDGHKSPGLQDPERYPFLPTAKSIEIIKQRNQGNVDSPGYWTFVRAFPPPQGVRRTILTEAMVLNYHMQDSVVWKDTFVKVAGLDPAFTADGDDCVLVTARVGMTSAGFVVICYDRVHYIPIRASDPRPVAEQIIEGVSSVLQTEDIQARHVGVDDSGTQSIGDMLVMKLGAEVYRVNFTAKPPDLPVSVANPTPASLRYRNQVTWMYYTIVEYAQRDQIKGLPESACGQFCNRMLRDAVSPLQLEAKRDYKGRNKQKSPDEADACAIIAAMCRERLGLMPGTSIFRPGGARVPRSLWQDQRLRDINNLETSYEFPSERLDTEAPSSVQW